MRAAQRVPLTDDNWGEKQAKAWSTIQEGLRTTITSSHRDRDKVVCVFTDACTSGWGFAITQCDPRELEKPWVDQRHELLAVGSGKFRSAQTNWHMTCKEAYPLLVAIKQHYHLLEGNVAFAVINDHKSLQHIFEAPMRSAYIPKPSRGRLARWALFLRTFTFDAHHIPGKVNFFCDLLSRNGCSTAAWQWAQQHGIDTSKLDVLGRQFAIIAPRPPPEAKESARDLELENVGLLPQMLGTT